MSKNAKIGIGALILLVLLLLAFSMSGFREAGAPVEDLDTSDQALQDDAAAIDAELQGLEGDRIMIDQGLETDVSVQ